MAGLPGIERLGYTHHPRSQRAARARGEDANARLPGVHRIASLAKRWLLGTHQGSVEQEHLSSYLNEYAFRFNRRRSRSPGMHFYRVLELAVGHPPVRYRDLVVDPRPKKVRPLPPAGGGHPASTAPELHDPGEPLTSKLNTPELHYAEPRIMPSRPREGLRDMGLVLMRSA